MLLLQRKLYYFKVNMKTILVTGGCGFIASNYIKKYVNDNNTLIINLDKLTYAANKQFLSDIENRQNYLFYKGDICDKYLVDKIFTNHNIDYVINFAAESHVDRSFSLSEDFFKTNVLGTLNLLETAKRHWKDFSKHKFIQISTDEVYGESEIECDESSKLNPTSPYSSSKASADLLCLSYFKSFNFPVVITRSSNNYGLNQHPEKLIPKLMVSLIANEKFFIHGSGNQLRDWLNVEDNINAINLVLKKGSVGEIYNISAKNEMSVNEVVNKVTKLASAFLDKDCSLLIENKGNRLYNDSRYNISNKKILALGFKLNADFDDSLKEMLCYYYDNFDYYYKKLKE